MALRRFVFTMPASGVQEFSTGNIVLLVTTSAAVNLDIYRGGTVDRATGLAGGVKIQRVVPWDNLQIIGTAGTTVEVLIGAENVQYDDIDVFTQIAVISGVASVAVAPSAQFNTTVADTALATATSADIAANLSRRRLTINANSLNTGSLWIRDQTATTNGGIELQPGLFVEIDSTAAIRIRNNSGASQSYSITEEV